MNRPAPEIFRQRLLIEGYYQEPMTEARLERLMVELCEALKLRPYAPPTIYAPASGMGRAENAGFDAFMPLIDSGLSAYVWSKPSFSSILIYSCTKFDEQEALSFVTEAMSAEQPIWNTSF